MYLLGASGSDAISSGEIYRMANQQGVSLTSDAVDSFRSSVLKYKIGGLSLIVIAVALVVAAVVTRKSV